jgi:hypothetical protein
MDRELLEKSLAEAERGVIDAERHIATQRDFVARLECDGHDPTQAMQLLQRFLELQPCTLPIATASEKYSGYESEMARYPRGNRAGRASGTSPTAARSDQPATAF